MLIFRFCILQPLILFISFFCTVDVYAITKIDDKVFVILRHVRNENDDKLWRRCYTSIREFYLNVPIVIIDDNSKITVSDDGLDDVIIIKSEYPGAGELLPYYYFLKHKWADKMIFLHDSMLLRRPFRYFELDHPVKFHWYFDVHLWDNDVMINQLLKKMKRSLQLLEYNSQKKSWWGCFGVASMVDLSILEEIESKYRFTHALINEIKSREGRMALERIFAILMFIEGHVTKETCSNFGNIFGFPRAWQVIDDDYLEDLKISYPGAILKTWHGR